MIGSGIKKDGEDPLHVQDIAEALQNPSNFFLICGHYPSCGMEKHILATASPSMTTAITCYEEVQKERMISHDSGNVFVEKGNWK